MRTVRRHLHADEAREIEPAQQHDIGHRELGAGEKLPTFYAFVRGEGEKKQVIDVAGVGDLLDQVYSLGKHGIEVKRFKGLGEMNSEELWDTTLDPTRRMLLRVTLEDAGEAERLFSVLMGEDVERRRQYIEDHALEVKNLDV